MTGARPGCAGPARCRRRGPSVRASGVLRPLPVSSATTSSPARMTPAPAGGGDRGERHAAGRLRVDALEPGDVADRLGRDVVLDRLDRAAGRRARPRRRSGRRPGLPIASERTIVSGSRTGSMTSVPAAQAVATGAQPAAWPPTKRIGRRSIRPELGELLEAARDAGEHRARGDRPDDDVRRAPAERLGDLVGEGLGALGVERPQVDVDEAPAGLVGDLEAEAVDVVVGAVDRDDGRAVGQGVVDLGRLEVGRDEDVGRQADRGRGGGGRAGQVAGRGAGERLDAELDGPGRGDRDRPVLEAERRVAGVVLEPQPVDARGSGARRSAASSGVEPTGSDRAGGASTGSSSSVAPDAGRSRARSPRGSASPRRRRSRRSTSSGPKQAGQTYDRPMGWVRPQLRQRMPVMRSRGVRVGRRRTRSGGWWQGLDRHGGSPGVRTCAASGPGYGTATAGSSRGGSEGSSLISQEDLPGLGTLPTRAGRLSWLQRAGPSATLDKSSSVVRGCYGRVARDRQRAERVRRVVACRHRFSSHPDRNLGAPSRNVVPYPANATVEADSCGRLSGHASRAAGRSVRDRPRQGVRRRWPPRSAARPPDPGRSAAAVPRANLLDRRAVRGRHPRTARASSPPTARSSSGPASTPVARPQDKFIVDEPSSRDKIWWGAVNRPITEAHYDRLRARLVAYCAEQDLYAQDLPHRRRPGAPAPPAGLHRDRLGEHLRAQPVPPARRPRELRRLRAELHDHLRAVVQGRPGDRGHPDRDRDPASTSSGWRSSSSAPSTRARSRSRAFTVMNYLMPDEGVLPMHSSVNVGAGRRQRRVLRPVGDGQDDPVGRPASAA